MGVPILKVNHEASICFFKYNDLDMSIYSHRINLISQLNCLAYVFNFSICVDGGHSFLVETGLGI